MQLFFHGFNLLFVSRFEFEDRGPNVCYRI